MNCKGFENAVKEASFFMASYHFSASLRMLKLWTERSEILGSGGTPSEVCARIIEKLVFVSEFVFHLDTLQLI